MGEQRKPERARQSPCRDVGARHDAHPDDEQNQGICKDERGQEQAEDKQRARENR
jgi:hypothetical protein